jgi:hypothetical protein
MEVIAPKPIKTIEMIKNHLTLVLVSFAIITGCKKETDNDTTDATYDTTFQTAEKSFSQDVDYVTKSGGSDTNCSFNGFLADCVEVTDSGEDSYPRTIILDYGDGCEGPGGNTRSGEIHISLTGPMDVSGSVRTVTFVDFSFNNRSLEGTRVTTRGEDNSEGQPTMTRVVDMSITAAGVSFERNFTEQITWLSGYDTPTCGDNVFEITGNGTVVRPNGVSVNRVIMIPMVIDQICGYTVSGVVSIEAPNGTRTLDYGDGSCDDQAIMTVNGNSFSITLH